MKIRGGPSGGPWTRSMRWSMDWVHEVVHGLGPQGWSMDWVHRGGPWTESTGSMDPGPCFVYVLPLPVFVLIYYIVN